MKNWQKVATLEEIPSLGSRVVNTTQGDLALFRTADNEVFALLDKCPHKGGHLSQGIVYGKKVACPMHGWQIALEDGNAVAPDVGCARNYPVKLEGNVVFISLT